MLIDRHGRQIRDLRISVTDRCNFRCSYCKSPFGMKYVHRRKLLTYEEIERLASIFCRLGVTKIRVTGGEPMLRKDLETLIRKLSFLEGVQDLALTTNGFNLVNRAESLKTAGLHRVTVSLDSLKKDRFYEITGNQDFNKILEGIDAARKYGLAPVKVNCVVVKDLNDDEIVDFVRFARDRQVILRFIEFMPLDEPEKWSQSKVITGQSILAKIRSEFDLIELKKSNRSETASRYGFPDAGGEIGLITTVSDPFCGACSRVRLTADGKIRNCLFSSSEFEIKSRLRDGSSDLEVEKRIREIINQKESGHRITEPDFIAPPRTISYIGG